MRTIRHAAVPVLLLLGGVILAGCSVSTSWPRAMNWQASAADVSRTLMTLPEPGTAKVPASIVTYVAPSQTVGVVDTAGPFVQDEYGVRINAPYQISYSYRPGELLQSFAEPIASRYFAPASKCPPLEVGLGILAVRPRFTGTQESGFNQTSAGGARVVVELVARLGQGGSALLHQTYQYELGGYSFSDGTYAGGVFERYMSSLLDQALAHALDRGFAALASRYRALRETCRVSVPAEAGR